MKDGDYQLNYHQDTDDVAQLQAGLSFVSHNSKNGILEPEKLDTRPPVAYMSFFRALL